MSSAFRFKRKDFKRFFYGHGGHLGHVTCTSYANFHSPSHGGFTWNWVSIGLAVSQEKSLWNIHCFTFFPYKSIRKQIWPCRKIGQGQHRVIIWTNLVVFEHLMLHTKFQGHWSFGSGEEDFLRFLPCMAWRPSWSCEDRLNKLSFPDPKETSHEIWLQSAQWFLRRCLKMLTHYTHTSIRTTDACLSYKLTTEPSAQVSLIPKYPA